MFDHVMAHEVDDREDWNDCSQDNDSVANMHVLARLETHLERTVQV
jgi:hypothetical protein